ncbi:hypothetical protein HHX47_DHR3000138 [Lentinula edodes]|nr:hypothetical protein HHX47_DHR3000138 [Lentinula edodes]
MAPSTTVPSASYRRLLKKRKQTEKAREERLAAAAAARKVNTSALMPTKPSKRSFSAESYVKEYLSQEKEEIRLKRAARSTSDFYVPAQPKVYFVVRIRGEPNLKSVRELIYKQGYGKVHKQRIPLSNNAVIKQALGQYNILSIEDLVHEIITVGPNFKQASNFLWPFNLSNPNGGSRTRKFKHYLQGGDFGDRETNINK